MSTDGNVIENRLKHLETHLEQENPVLLSTVQSFRQLDGVAHRMGLLEDDQSLATQIPWWPLISVLGTFSAGKSTFINDYLSMNLQRSGNQAVDEKFTVICYAKEETPHALPGVALDSDPRFPFYRISAEIDKVAQGEGSRIDAYLQLKTCPAEALRGKILIDSPGFDADAQRTSTLRITDHIIDLSDLVLVFFDARHPEPGAMRDTLDHLVSRSLNRPDSGKFLYILNQIDTTAREDNPEEVIAAWQRALGERGLTAGRFYTIYNQAAAAPITDEALRHRYESKRDADMGEIHGRMQQVEIERAYRIVGTLEKSARDIQDRAAPALTRLFADWRRRVLIGDVLVFGLAVAAFLAVTINAGQWHGLRLETGWWEWLRETPARVYGSVLGLFLVALAVHFGVRSLAAKTLLGRARRLGSELGLRVDLAGAFARNTRFWRSIFATKPAGWGRGAKRRITEVLQNSDDYVQRLNDRFTNPSGAVPAPLDEPDAPQTVALEDATAGEPEQTQRG
ncbi:MAG: dynamin family protein [Gammaproteobacteria bacterium]